MDGSAQSTILFLSARAPAPDLVLPPRETTRRYAAMAPKEAIVTSVRACEAYMPMCEHP